MHLIYLSVVSYLDIRKKKASNTETSRARCIDFRRCSLTQRKGWILKDLGTVVRP